MTGFPAALAHQLESVAPDRRWLIDHLWEADAVGIIGGEPKSCKSFLALSMAVSVASGVKCLSEFPTRLPGPVLVYAAEDALHVVRERLELLTHPLYQDLSVLKIWVITAPRIRLDVLDDRRRLEQTVANIQPVLLILDPFVRLHAVDENQAAAVAPLLAFLRHLQRTYHCAVAVVHHARKGAQHIRPGQALRGSSEFHAWSDSSLYVRRTGNSLRLTIEHRAHQSPGDFDLTVHSDPKSVRLVAREREQEESDPEPSREDARGRVLDGLRKFGRPVGARELRSVCRMRMANMCEILAQLEGNGVVRRGGDGWMLDSGTK